jgi:hypothetical protein
LSHFAVPLEMISDREIKSLSIRQDIFIL